MITFRIANLNDIPSINVLTNSAYRGEYAKQGWTTEADLIDGQRIDETMLNEIITQPHHEIILAHTNEELVGCIHVHYESETSLYFGMLTVEPSKQALGIGSKLLSHIDHIAKDRGMKQIRMVVLPQRKELIAYYTRRGFVATGRWEEFPNDPKYGVPKIANLRLDEYIKTLL